MYLSYEQVAAINTVKTADDLNIPARATHAEIQADTNQVRYTMDGETNPQEDVGMIFEVDADPELFLIEDVRNIRFRDDGEAGNLNIHYSAGRDV